jgi:hypothetical protein
VQLAHGLRKHGHGAKRLVLLALQVSSISQVFNLHGTKSGLC